MIPYRIVIVVVSMLSLGVVARAQESRPTSRPESPSGEANPAAEGFDHEGSDAKAIEIADAVMEKMGGRQAWDDTRYITWKFFGSRLHVWDKHTGDIRVEFEREGVRTVLLANLHTKKGAAWIDGEEIKDEEKLSGLMDNAISAWINDSYWLVMPYKLKDSGVTLTFVGEADMEDGRTAEVLQLVFTDVGVTPGNKYHVYVAKESGLIEQWDYFRNADDEEAGFKIPWHNWKQYGEIMLSADRGMRRGNPSRHTDVAVYEELPRSIFESPEPIDWTSIRGDEKTMN